MGHLVPAVYYGSLLTPDLQGIPLVAGDYNKKVLGQRVNKSKLVGDILENWLRIGGDRQTIIFATNVKHSLHICRQFEQHGIAIEHLDAHTPPEDRAKTLSRFEKKETQVITNVALFGEGADFPWASCVVLAKPTKSWARYVQMGSRGLRPYPNKKDCIIIDHAGTVEQHGYLDEPVVWTLGGKEKAWVKPKQKEDEEKPPLTCEQCRYQFRGRVCPHCGLKVVNYGKSIAVVEGRLHRLKRGKKKTSSTEQDKENFLAMAEYYRRMKKYKPGWTAWTYKKKFREWPPWDRDHGTEKPDRAFKNFLTHLNIRRIMGRKKGG